MFELIIINDSSPNVIRCAAVCSEIIHMTTQVELTLGLNKR